MNFLNLNQILFKFSQAFNKSTPFLPPFMLTRIKNSVELFGFLANLNNIQSCSKILKIFQKVTPYWSENILKFPRQYFNSFPTF